MIVIAIISTKQTIRSLQVLTQMILDSLLNIVVTLS